LIEILPAHRTLPTSPLAQATASAVGAGLVDPQVMLIECRRHGDFGDDAARTGDTHRLLRVL
jgi:hypothetical protein